MQIAKARKASFTSLAKLKLTKCWMMMRNYSASIITSPMMETGRKNSQMCCSAGKMMTIWQRNEVYKLMNCSKKLKCRAKKYLKHEANVLGRDWIIKY